MRVVGLGVRGESKAEKSGEMPEWTKRTSFRRITAFCNIQVDWSPSNKCKKWRLISFVKGMFYSGLGMNQGYFLTALVVNVAKYCLHLPNRSLLYKRVFYTSLGFCFFSISETIHQWDVIAVLEFIWYHWWRWWLVPFRRHAITLTNDYIFSSGALGTVFNEMPFWLLSFAFKKMRWKMLRSFCKVTVILFKYLRDFCESWYNIGWVVS